MINSTKLYKQYKKYINKFEHILLNRERKIKKKKKKMNLC